MSNDKCPAKECGAYGGHHPLCPLAPPEYKEAQLTRYMVALNQGLERYRLMAERVTLWQGKHALLRHENNRLRKKLREMTGGKEK